MKALAQAVELATHALDGDNSSACLIVHPEDVSVFIETVYRKIAELRNEDD